jgi:hypothetical protein
MSNVSAQIANARKAIIQVCTLIVTFGTAVLTFSQLPDKYAALVTAGVGFAGSVLHYAVPNAPAPGTAPAEEPFDDSVDDEVTPDMKPAELITAEQVGSSLPPETELTKTDPPTQ